MRDKKILIGGRVVGILSCPNKEDAEGNFPAVLLLHGFATDKNEVNGIYEKMAAKLKRTE